MFNTLMCQALAISQKKIFTNIHKTRWLFKSWNKIISLWCLFLHLQWPCYHDHDRCGSGACISRDTGYWVRDRKIHLDGMRAHTFTHTWTPRGNLVSPICLPACFWQWEQTDELRENPHVLMESMQNSTRTPDTNPSSGLKQGLFVTIIIIINVKHVYM